MFRILRISFLLVLPLVLLWLAIGRRIRAELWIYDYQLWHLYHEPGKRQEWDPPRAPRHHDSEPAPVTPIMP
jgi:hypothetical protein